MDIISRNEGLTLLVVFGAAMLLLVWRGTKGEKSAESFLVADRNLSLLRGSFSIAVSWIWAPAIFICSMQAYTKGLPGIFWFTVPNILCFFLFAPFAIKLRRRMPKGYTFPQYIAFRYQDNTLTHLAFLVLFLGYQLGAIIINALAGGALLHAVSGVDLTTAIIGMTGISLIYSLFSGLKASVLTDLVQMLMILLIGFVLVPWCLMKTDGLTTLWTGLGGMDGTYRSLLNSKLAFFMGIPMTLSLLSGPFADQMFFQRALSVRKNDVVKTFLYGGLLFGIVPILLSLLGFIGSSLTQQGLLVIEDPQLVGPAVIAHLLPRGALYAFCLMAFAGLCSTMDSSFCAVSSLGSIDIYKRYINPKAEDLDILRISRLSMFVFALLGTAIALLEPKLLWVFLIYGALASAGLFPAMLALVWDKVTARGAFWAVSLSLLIGTPLSIYANVQENPNLIVGAALLSVSIGLAICLLSAAGQMLRKHYVRSSTSHGYRPA